MKLPRRRWWLLAALVVAFATVLVWRARQPGDLERHLARLRAEGIPTTFAELDAWYPAVPDAENAVPPLLEIASAFRRGSDTNLPVVGYAKAPRRGEPWPPELLAAAQARLATKTDDFAKLTEALARPRARFSHHSTLTIPSPSGLRLHGIIIWLELRARVVAELAQPALAVQCLREQIRIARTLDNERGLIPYLEQHAQDRMAVGSGELVLSRIALAEADLRKLQHSYASAANSLSYERAIVGDLCYDLEGLRLSPVEFTQYYSSAVNLFGFGATDGFWQEHINEAGTWLYCASGMRQRDLRIILDYEDDLRKTAKLSPARRFSAANNLNHKLAQTLKSQFAPLTRYLLQVRDRLPEIFAHHYAVLRCAEVACAVERWRLAHAGALPPSLDALVPQFLAAVPEDPMDGKPLKFRPRPKGFVVYSIGEDGTDDGGTEHTPGKTNRWDYTFVVER